MELAAVYKSRSAVKRFFGCNDEAKSMFVKFQGKDDPDETVRILRNWTLSFSKPRELNDPYESSPEHYELSTREFSRHVESRCRDSICRSVFVRTGRRIYRWSSEYRQRLQFIISCMQSMGPELAKDCANIVQEKVNEYGVFCVSNIPSVLGLDAALMWTHYAKEHTGIAIALNHRHRVFWSGECPPEERGKHYYLSGADLDGFHPVKYAKTRPKIPINIDRPPESMRALLNKSLVWRYEKEWRCIKRVRDGGSTRKVSEDGRRLLLKGDPTLVTDVFIGARASIETKKAVFKALCQPGTEHITVHELRLSQKWYELEIADQKRAIA